MVRAFVYILVFIFLFVKTMAREQVNRYLFLGVALLAGMVFFSMLLHGDSAAEYWLLVMIISFFLVNNYDILDFAQKYERIMRVLCLLFLGGFLILSVNPYLVVSPLWQQLEKWEVVYAHSSMLQYYQAGIVPMRAYGVFREPGVYQMYAILAMLVCLYTKKKLVIENLIYSLAVLTTHSTTGYICLLLIYGVWVLKILSVKNRKSIIILMGCIAAGIIVVPYFLKSIILKFTATGINAHSWMSRFASFATNIYLWLKNPLFGIGMSGVAEHFADVTRNVFGLNAGGVAITDDTNSILIYFAAYGLIPGIIFCVGIWKGIRKVEKSMLCSLIIMLMFVCLFAGEQVNNTCYPYVLVFGGLVTEKMRIGRRPR